jgi:hypothetical protein
MNKSPIRVTTRTVAGVVVTNATFTVVFGPDPSHQRMMAVTHSRPVDEAADQAQIDADLRAKLAAAMHHNLLNDDWSY